MGLVAERHQHGINRQFRRRGICLARPRQVARDKPGGEEAEPGDAEEEARGDQSGDGQRRRRPERQSGRGDCNERQAAADLPPRRDPARREAGIGRLEPGDRIGEEAARSGFAEAGANRRRRAHQDAVPRFRECLEPPRHRGHGVFARRDVHLTSRDPRHGDRTFADRGNIGERIATEMDHRNEGKPETARALAIRRLLGCVRRERRRRPVQRIASPHLPPIVPPAAPSPPAGPSPSRSASEPKTTLTGREIDSISRAPVAGGRWVAGAVIAVLLTGAAGILLQPPVGAAGAWAQVAEPTIPGFWDPKRRVERPAAGAVQTIRFVTTDDFPPFNFLDADGHLTGFNVDLTRAICAELAIRCTIQAREWDDLLNTLRQGSADAIIAGIAITAQAREELDFSDVYMRWPGRFVVRRDAPAIEFTPEGLKGKTLAVVARTAHEAYLAAFFPEVGRKLYPTPEAARQALKSGEADAHFGDGMQLSFWLQSAAAADCCIFAGGPYLETRFFGDGLAIAVPRGKSDLKQALDAALAAIEENGIYSELYLRYFPVGFF